ncbi:hypothetical protein [Rhodoglobus aureus]|uniref:AAA family ATPase n=1 Tax=Rhodoglobus aureus TaxID=191497 RepID=A0ABN1VLY7_9MICO
MFSFDDALPHRPRRVVVAGVSGSGKTTLAVRIAKIIGSRHTEIDALFHGPQWMPRPDFLDDVRALIATESWTTEWQHDSARPILAAHADDADVNVNVNLHAWQYTAGWFQAETDLDNSTVFSELGDNSLFALINHCRWDRLAVLPRDVG